MPRIILAVLLFGTLAACGAPEEVTRDQRQRPAHANAGLTLAPSLDDVRTVQLYRAGNESSLPVIALASGQQLTLEFDRIDDGRGGPLSVYFYHTDRHWNRRLLSVEYLRGFQSDQVRDYEPSSATRVRYTHYTYSFPNDVIEFTRSGNFVVRVTEQGDERAVLLERAFFITEEIAEVDLSLQHGYAAGLGGPMLQPVARVRPPGRYDSPIHDFNVCFARDGRFELIRCSQEPTLLGTTLFQYYLPEERAFRPRGPVYDLDLSILGAGPHIASVDLSTDPYRVVLNADDARFAGAFFDDQLLSGQTLVRSVVQDSPRPATQAEYVETTFRFVPPERSRVAGRVILTGSFNAWMVDPANQLEWDPEANEYRGAFLMKQGKYTYAYYVEDPAEQERRRRTVDIGRPSLYTAFVYLHDPTYDTDRLISVQNALGQ